MFADFWSEAKESFIDFNKAINRPIYTALSAPGKALDPRIALKEGFAMGRAAEKFTSNINPLNTTLKSFNQEGIKRGGVIGGFLGRTGEFAREKPIATIAIVYGAALATGLASGPGAASGTGGGALGAGGEAAEIGAAAAPGITAGEVAAVGGGTITAAEIIAGTTATAGLVGAGTQLANAAKKPAASQELVDAGQDAGESVADMLNEAFSVDNLPLIIGGIAILGVTGYYLANRK